MIADVGSGCGQEAVVDWIGKVFSEVDAELELYLELELDPKPLMWW